MSSWNTPAPEEAVEKTILALKKNNIAAFVVADEDAAREKALFLIPDAAEVMEMTSVTLDALGMAEALRAEGKFTLVRDRLAKMNRETQHQEMQELGAAPQVAIGSVHAVTEDGSVVIASNTGSQLPAYAYGADKVIWVVGTQKIVPNLDAAFKRVYEHSLPLESERAKKAYGVPGSAVNKLLVVNKENTDGRLTIIFVNKVLGF